MKNTSDEKLIKQIVQGGRKSDKAFAALIDRYSERLYWHIRKMVYSHDDANDVLQNTLVKVFENISGFRSDSKLYTWLYRIATNEALSFLQKQQRNQTDSIENHIQLLSNNLESDEWFQGSEIQLQLQKAIAKLPEKQRLVFNMKYFDDMKYQEMAEVLETSIGALKASYHHAVKKIEENLKSEAIRG